MSRPAILFSVNPYPGLDVFDDPRLGRIDEHKKFIRKNGSVNWNLIRNFRKDGPLEDYYTKIKKGYIYHVPDGRVSHTCEINWIKRGDKLTPHDLKFTPHWRGTDLDQEWITMNIKKFTLLDKRDWLSCKDFKSYSTSKNLKQKYIINYGIVEEL